MLTFKQELLNRGCNDVTSLLSEESLELIEELYTEETYQSRFLHNKCDSSYFIGIATSFTRKKSLEIRLVFTKKALQTLKSCECYLDAHFVLSNAIPILYRERSDERYYSLVKKVCVKMIDIAPKVAGELKKDKKLMERFGLPAHDGYQQLAVIYDKEKKYEPAIQVCRKALSEGWHGDWNERIEKLEKKLNK